MATNRKTFLYRGHRYRIVLVLGLVSTDSLARSTAKRHYDGLETAVRQLRNGHWAVGVRVGSVGRSGLVVR